MTQEDKIKKIIEKAVENGWEHLGFSIALKKQKRGEVDLGWTEENWIRYISNEEYYKTVFSHSFAKAIWGESYFKDFSGNFGKPGEFITWQYHLQKAVISDDPIDYYYKNM